MILLAHLYTTVHSLYNSVHPTSARARRVQELFELAQRKFYRQLCSYVDQMAEKQAYPNLVVLDLAEPKPGAAPPAEPGPGSAGESSQAHLFDSISRLPFCLKLLCEFDGVRSVPDVAFNQLRVL